MSRLLIVSNRLPVTVKLERGKIQVSESIGGLATGLRGPHQSGKSLWVGWPGEVLPREGQRSYLEKELADLRAVPVYLTQSEINRYYEAFSNGVLWPLFHYQTDRLQRDAWRHWRTYQEVNQRFADVVARNYRSGDLIWVHDYQLTLVPAMLRQLLPQARIGYFLHIPFPSSEVFRILPWRSQILEGILGADLVGFHTYSYMRHFMRALLLVLGVESEGEMLTYGERKILTGVFPIGVDAAELGRLADRESVLAKVKAVRQECGGRKLILGVDRLDYTKGLPRRMLAMDRLLEREPGLRDKVRMIQIVVPSRTQVDTYEQYRQKLDELVGRINGAHATVNSVPIHYLYRSLPQTELVALYRSADLMLVTPLRDGMNLVAKEFVATRTDEDGILLLSEFAGAAEELREAVSVNPYDIDGVATTIKHSLSLPEEERRARMRVLRSRVMTYDCYHWSDNFIKALETAPGVTAEPLEALSTNARMQAMLETLGRSDHLLLLLDYDGTLVPLASSPQLAVPDPELKKLLKALAARPDTAVHIVSGRPAQVLESWLGGMPIGLHAEHGFWSRPGPGKPWQHNSPANSQWKEVILPILEQFAAWTPGSLIERKSAGLAWHYRMADPEMGKAHAQDLKHRIEGLLPDLSAEMVLGHKVIEVRTRGIHKGMVVPTLAKSGEGDWTVLAVGDDRTDEELFAALPPGSFAIHVGSGESRASYRLADPAAVRDFLSRLLEGKPRRRPLLSSRA